MSALAFYLDAPMQSWGAASKFQHRETGAFPTKSGIVGLVAAALGIDKHSPDEAERLAPLSALRFTAVRLQKPHPTQAESELPVNRLSDFHTIGGGYDKKGPLREKLSIPKKASGPPFGTVITHRAYLTDAAFAVILEGDADTLEGIRTALLDPVWGVWFGRKTCLPASPLTPTPGDHRDAAFEALLAALPGREPANLSTFEFQEECESTDSGDGTFHQSDQPVAFGKHHGPVPEPYHSRPVRHHRPSS